MKLGAIADAAGIALPSGAELPVTGFAIDNRKVAKGCVFGAFQGAAVNGEDFIPAAVQAGAVAVVARPEATVQGAVHIADANPRRAFARLAAQFYTPVPETVVAVTGTNGKTSTVEMTRQIWRMCGHRAASIGTLGVTTSDESVSTGLTTPDIVTFFANMTGLAREGVSHVAYEASSHGLSQFRNEGLRVRAGAFTNLSRDHLDYHKDMEDYFAAKMRLFSEVVEDGGTAVVWADDGEWSARASEQALVRGLSLFTVGEEGEHIRLLARQPGQLGQVLEIEFDGQKRKVNLPLIGAYQAANALVSAGLAIATGEDAARVFDAVARLQPVRGRLERAAITRSGAPVYVDYAHTPDALVAAIAALRPRVSGRLIPAIAPKWAVSPWSRRTLPSSPMTIRAARMPQTSAVRFSPERPARAKWAIGAKPLPPPLPRRAATTSSSSPARATNRARSSGAVRKRASSPSMTSP